MRFGFKGNHIYGRKPCQHYDAATEPSSHEQSETANDNLQDDVNIFLNQSDSNPEVENDVGQDQPKVPENKTQLHRSS